MILHVRCLKDLSKVLDEYVGDKREEFIKTILNVRGTNSSFKLVFKELLDHIDRRSETKE